jgi:glycosyltransferase involved in cell wall biosynthesis
VVAIPRRISEPWPFFWRFAFLADYWRCSRGLMRQDLPSADVVVAGEHLFLKAHARKFPEVPWLYLPHSLVVHQEIASYGLLPVQHWVTSRLYSGLQRWALNHADRTLRFTRQACEAVSAYYKNSVRPRFAVNPMGVVLPAAPQLRESKQPVRLLWVGQLIPRKRLDVALVDVALAALGGLRNSSWRFDIVGGGESRPALEALTDQLGLRERVSFHGFQPNPERWYTEADLLLFPSWLENCPVTMMESMSYGVPCLAMRGDGVRFHNANSEIITHGKDGFLADSDEDFTAQLASLIRQPELISEARRASWETIASRHTWDKHLDRYEELFDTLLAERRRTPRSGAQRRREALTR